MLFPLVSISIGFCLSAAVDRTEWILVVSKIYRIENPRAHRECAAQEKNEIYLNKWLVINSSAIPIHRWFCDVCPSSIGLACATTNNNNKYHTKSPHNKWKTKAKILSVHINRSIKSRCKHPGIMSIQIIINRFTHFSWETASLPLSSSWASSGPLSDFHCALSMIWKIAIIHFNSLLNRILSVRPSLYHRITEYIVRRMLSLPLSLAVAFHLRRHRPRTMLTPFNGRAFYNEKLKHFRLPRHQIDVIIFDNWARVRCVN